MTCLICDSSDIDPLVNVLGVPTHCNVLWPSREAALRAPRGDLSLGWCRACGHLFNTTFNPHAMAYTPEYENSLHFSPHYQRYAEEVARDLIARYGLKGRTVIDVGCGKGEFLTLICALGDNDGVGFDRSYTPDAAADPRVRFVQDFYSEAYADEPVDLLACRHVLEHIDHPLEFLAMLRRTLATHPEAVLFFELPNALFTLRDHGVWDLIYEHCSYFTATSLTMAFARAGFSVLRVEETYHSQFLCLEARLAPAPTTAAADTAALRPYVASYAAAHGATLGYWREQLARLRRDGQQVAVWGSGSKGVTFLNTADEAGAVAWVVDINPRKHGKFVAGTGQPVVPPEYLREARPDVVLVMNPAYMDEIAAHLGKLGVAATLRNVMDVPRPAAVTGRGDR